MNHNASAYGRWRLIHSSKKVSQQLIRRFFFHCCHKAVGSVSTVDNFSNKITINEPNFLLV